MNAKQRNINELVGAFEQMLEGDYSTQALERLVERQAEVMGGIRGVLTRHIQPEPTLPERHADIRVPVEVGGLKFLICGFLGNGDNAVDGETMFRLTAVQGTESLNEGDWERLGAGGDRFPFPHELYEYHFATGRSEPGYPNRMSCFAWNEGRRRTFWVARSGPWGKMVLVVRRVSAAQ